MRVVSRVQPLLKPLRHACAGTVWTVDFDHGGTGVAAWCPHRAADRPPSHPLADVSHDLRRELEAPRRGGRPAWVWFSPASDPFTPTAPQALRETSLEALSHLLRRGIGATLVTRGGHPEADGLLTLARRFPGLLRVEIGVFSGDAATRERWELGTAPIGSRYALAGALRRAGAEVVGRIGPIIPFVNDREADLRKLVRPFVAQGVHTVVPDFIVDGPGLVAQVEREVSRSTARVLQGWFGHEAAPRTGPRRLADGVRASRYERLVAVAAPLGIEVLACECTAAGSEASCLRGPSGLAERGQLDLFGVEVG